MSLILALVGPTASGKTPLSLLLAGKLNGEIVSADSRQIYKHLDIGTAKPDKAELRSVPHHFINIRELHEEYNAGVYGEQARKTIVALQHRKKEPILVGGSGLYVRSVIDGFFEGPGKDPDLRSQLQERLERSGLLVMFDELKKVDPVSASRMKEVKSRQVLRALEVYYITGKPISRLHEEQRKDPGLSFAQFAIDWDRKTLYERINARVEGMLQKGLVEEVESLLRSGYDRRLNALNTVGYKEVFQYLDGTLKYETMVNLIKQNTRRFAKRQLTWFRADPRIQWLPVGGDEENFEALADLVLTLFRKRSQKVH